MTEYVQLPIFDEKGMQTGDVLIIEVGALQATCGFRAKISERELYDQELARQEVEYLDRVVHDLPVKAARQEFLGEWTNKDLGVGETGTHTSKIPRYNPPYWMRSRDVPLVQEEGGEVEVVDFSSKYPPEFFEPLNASREGCEPFEQTPSIEWRDLEGYQNYKMSNYRVVVDKETDRVVEPTMGRIPNVLLVSPVQDRRVRVSVDFLFKKTFPELNI